MKKKFHVDLLKEVFRAKDWMRPSTLRIAAMLCFRRLRFQAIVINFFEDQPKWSHRDSLLTTNIMLGLGEDCAAQVRDAASTHIASLW